MRKAREEGREAIKGARRIVVKVGSAVLAGRHEDELDEGVFSALASDIVALKGSGKEVVLVTSGAIAVGMKKMGLKRRPGSIPEKQAVAAVGQSSLMAIYEGAFTPLGVRAAQVLLTHGDLADRKRFLNARNTLVTLFQYGVIPIINENDTVAVEEIKFGENDHLAALVTSLAEADLLIMLTDIDGLYDADPRISKTARLIPVVDDVDHVVLGWAGKASGVYGTGGMQSKIEAARKAAHIGVPTVVAGGKRRGVIERILSGTVEGTLFLPKEDRLTSKKHWIAFSARPGGRIFVDEGAMTALLKGGKSLLPSGITGVDGRFDTGEVVHCVDHRGKEFARGITTYNSSEIEKIRGVRSTEIEKVLGYRYYDEVIHRDNLVIL
ncbi:MAG: glutamate 5-kinase [Thermodesulfobacteriota bacterium]